MKRLNILLFTAIASLCPIIAPAQDIHFNSADSTVSSLHFKFEPVQDSIYNVYGQNEEMQMMFPLYLPAGKGTLEIRLQNGCPMVENDDNNRALSAFNLLTYVHSRKYWMEGSKWSAEQIKDYIKSYKQATDSILALYNPVEPVRQYLCLWSYLHTFNEFDSMPNAVRRKPSDLGLTIGEFLERPETVLDVPMATHFSLASYAIYRSLPAGTSYDERIAYLNEKYTNEQLRAQVSAMLEKKRTAPKGMPFPKDVTLTDRDGNTVDFAQFRGKYVYIDMWASWCGPCCKEVPYLQELEKTLDNPDVVFVSVSLDTTEKPWKAKMEQLDMHGNQLLNADGSFAKALYVSSIPHFVIYDKEGKLYMTGAPRPSNPSTLLLLKDLH